MGLLHHVPQNLFPYPMTYIFYLQKEFLGLLDVPEADLTPEVERRELRLEAERNQFEDEHYL